METIDLIAEYGNRNIDGADCDDLRRALMDEPSDVFRRDSANGATFVHVATGRKVQLDCVWKYFEPPKPYYRLNAKSDCGFVRKAMELPHRYDPVCSDCLLQCLGAKLKIKPSKVRFATSYFLK